MLYVITTAFSSIIPWKHKPRGRDDIYLFSLIYTQGVISCWAITDAQGIHVERMSLHHNFPVADEMEHASNLHFYPNIQSYMSFLAADHTFGGAAKVGEDTPSHRRSLCVCLFVYCPPTHRQSAVRSVCYSILVLTCQGNVPVYKIGFGLFLSTFELKNF